MGRLGRRGATTLVWRSYDRREYGRECGDPESKIERMKEPKLVEENLGEVYDGNK